MDRHKWQIVSTSKCTIHAEIAQSVTFWTKSLLPLLVLFKTRN